MYLHVTRYSDRRMVRSDHSGQRRCGAAKERTSCATRGTRKRPLRVVGATRDSSFKSPYFGKQLINAVNRASAQNCSMFALLGSAWRNIPDFTQNSPGRGSECNGLIASATLKSRRKRLPSGERIVKWHTYTSMKTRLRRGYIGNALNAGGNRCICISGKSSSLSICAQMNIAGAAIAG